MSLTRLCKRCSEEKDVSLFPIDKRNVNWKNKVCKSCCGKRANKNKSSYWKLEYNWKRRGINLEEAALVKDQGECQICGNKERLHLDHCHKTNKVRGMLCHKCNRALGFFNDNAERLRKAADYVDKNGKHVYN